MDWKDEFDEFSALILIQHCDLELGIVRHISSEYKEFMKVQFEKLIQEVTNDSNRIVNDNFKQQLRAKWLGKE